MELDHLFICVAPGAAEGGALRKFGLTEGTPNTHPGQGTANRRFFFRNMYIELLFLDDAVAIDAQLTRPTMLLERLRGGELVCPFGFCFRPNGDEQAVFPSWPYQPMYLPPNLQIDIAMDVPLSEPMWFFSSFGVRPDAMPKERVQPMTHSLPLQEVTKVSLTLPHFGVLSAVSRHIAELEHFEILAGDAYGLEISFTSGEFAAFHDFEPTLPLKFRW